jgi:glycosyltransferase involved in cell wall biosynthesis
MKNNKKVVLFVTPFFSPSIGGAETLLEDIIKFITRNKYYAIVSTFQPITSNVKGLSQEKNENFEIFRFQYFGHRIFNFLIKFNPVINFLYLFPYLCFRTLLLLYMKKEEIDVVDSHGLVGAVINLIQSKLFKKPAVMTIVAIYDFNKNTLFSKFVQIILNQADAIIVESEASKRELCEIGVKDNKIVIFKEWVDLDKFRPKKRFNLRKKLKIPQKLTLLFVGRAVRSKGLDFFLNIINKLPEDIYKIIISGSGPLQSELTKFENNNTVKIKYNLPYFLLPDYYAAADIFIAPARSEDAPRTIVESLSCGTPVIASSIGGIPSIVNEKIGLLISSNESELLKGILKLRDNPEILKKMKKYARIYAEKNFSINNANTFLKTYEKFTK